LPSGRGKVGGDRERDRERDRDQGRGSTKRFNEEIAHVDYMSSLMNKRGKTSGKGCP
jgi:hypothetical protein